MAGKDRGIAELPSVAELNSTLWTHLDRFADAPALIDTDGGTLMTFAQLTDDSSVAGGQAAFMALDGSAAGLRAALTAARRGLCVPYHPEWPASEVSRLSQRVQANLGPYRGQTGFLLTTSGTSGEARIVHLNPKMLLGSTRNIIRALGLLPRDRQIVAAPLHHVFGLLNCLASLVSGGSVIPSSYDARHWLAWLETSGATWYAAPPAIHSSVLARLSGRPTRHHLRFVRSSTAPLASTVRQALSQALGVPVLESYGMTETTSQIASMPLGAHRSGSVGKVLGPEVRIQGGPVGEIWVRGETVMAGYLDPGPQPLEDGWLRTGDLGRLDEDGYLYLHGRQTEVINRGGEKVHPVEIERLLESHPAVLRAVAFAVPDERLGQEVMAAVVTRNPVRERSLLQFAGERLVAHKRPRRIVFCEELPEGKFQRDQLAAGFRLPARVDTDSSPELVEWLRQSFAETLQIGEVGADQGFFELGGDSLLATLLLNRLRSSFGRQISPVALFQSDTPRGLAAYLSEESELEDGVAAHQEEEHPLSFAQERMWSLAQLLPDEPLDNSGRFLKIRGPLDPFALERALATIIERHALLRSTFHEKDGQPYQRVHPGFPSPPWLRQSDLREESDPEASAYRLAEIEAARIFDFEKEGLFRATLLRLAEQQWVLLLMRHHLVSDGWSIALFLKELQEAYKAALDGRPADLFPLSNQYFDFARWQRSQLDGIQRDLDYWRARFRDLRATRLPGRSSQANSFRADFHTFLVKAETVAQLKEAAAGRGTTLYVLLLAGFKAALAAWTGESEVVLGSPNANRNRLEWEPLLGFFVNTMVLRSKVSPHIEELVRSVKTTVNEALAHQTLPFEELIRRLETGADLFRILFVLLNAPVYQPEWPGLEVANWGPGPRTVRLDMELHFFPQISGELEGWCVYNRDKYEQSAMLRFTDDYQLVLEALANGNPLPRLLAAESPAAELPMTKRPLTENERELVQIWEQKLSCPVVCDVPMVQFGGSSLVALQVALEIERRWARRPPLAELLSSTIREQSLQLDRPVGKSTPLVALKPGRGIPFFFVHPIGGGAQVYHQLAQQLGERPVFGFQALDGPGADTHLELPELAKLYCKYLLAVQPEGPYLLAGLSYGGVLAYEMARNLGPDQVGFLGLIDSFRPGLRYEMDLPHRLYHAYQRCKLNLHGWLLEPGSYIQRKFRERTTVSRPAPSGLRPAYDRYSPGPYDGSIDLYRANYQPLSYRNNSDLGWTPLVKSLRVHSIAGLHGTGLLELPLARGLADQLRTALREF